MRLLVCLLAVTCWASATSASDAFDVIGMRNLTDPMKKCLRLGKMYSTAGKTCHELPDVTKCGARGWMVLDSARVAFDDRLEPVCKNKTCTKPLHVFWPATQKCIKMKPQNVCPKGNELRNDVYGEAYCGCMKSPASLPLTMSENAVPCYELYTKGPCAQGVLNAKHVNGKGYIAECHSDPCANKKSKDPLKKFAQLNGKCYELGQRGPCEEKEVFQVVRPFYKPVCVDSVLVLNLFSSMPNRCPTISDGLTCAREIEIMEKNNLDAEIWEKSTAITRQRKRN